MRVYVPERYDNDQPAPDVNHQVPVERELIAVLDLAFESPLTRRAFYDTEAFQRLTEGLKQHVAFTTAFAVSSTHVYVRDKQLTTAGLRGSRPAQLIEQLGANNQVTPEVCHLMLNNRIKSADG